jgi:hypothetical protein
MKNQSKKTKKSHIVFTRKDINSLENMVILKIKHTEELDSPYQVFNAFSNAITKWVENTEEGRALWNYTSEDLNIGDILSSGSNKSLAHCMKKEGILKWKPIYELIDQEEFSYDKVLASPSN